MTNCADTARRPDEQRLVDVASILAAGILRLRERPSAMSGKTGLPVNNFAARRFQVSLTRANHVSGRPR